MTPPTANTRASALYKGFTLDAGDDAVSVRLLTRTGEAQVLEKSKEVTRKRRCDSDDHLGPDQQIGLLRRALRNAGLLEEWEALLIVGTANQRKVAADSKLFAGKQQQRQCVEALREALTSNYSEAVQAAVEGEPSRRTTPHTLAAMLVLYQRAHEAADADEALPDSDEEEGGARRQHRRPPPRAAALNAPSPGFSLDRPHSRSSTSRWYRSNSRSSTQHSSTQRRWQCCKLCSTLRCSTQRSTQRSMHSVECYSQCRNCQRLCARHSSLPVSTLPCLEAKALQSTFQRACLSGCHSLACRCSRARSCDALRTRLPLLHPPVPVPLYCHPSRLPPLALIVCSILPTARLFLPAACLPAACLPCCGCCGGTCAVKSCPRLLPHFPLFTLD